MKPIRFASADALASAQARAMEETAARCRQRGQPNLIMVSGGQTPRGAFEELAHNPEALRGPIHVVLSDERVVPLDSPDSNYGWIAPLLEKAGLESGHFHFIPCDLPETQAAEAFRETLLRLCTIAPVWGDAFLGMGADGHTCGIFSMDDAVDSREVLRTDRADGRRGITTGRSVLECFNRIILSLSGEGKRARLQDLLNQPLQVITGRMLSRHPRVEIWADRDAYP